MQFRFPSSGNPVAGGAFQGDTHTWAIRILYAAGMQVGLRHFDARPRLARRALSADGMTRHGPAREHCKRTGWSGPLGRPCQQAAAKALPTLA